MKRIVLFMVALLTISSYTSYASFPVVVQDYQAEVVVCGDVEDEVAAVKKFEIGGFLLGFLLGLIGVLISYLFSKNPDFRRSSWYGLAAWAIIYLLFIPSKE